MKRKSPNPRPRRAPRRRNPRLVRSWRRARPSSTTIPSAAPPPRRASPAGASPRRQRGGPSSGSNLPGVRSPHLLRSLVLIRLLLPGAPGAGLLTAVAKSPTTDTGTRKEEHRGENSSRDWREKGRTLTPGTASSTPGGTGSHRRLIAGMRGDVRRLRREKGRGEHRHLTISRRLGGGGRGRQVPREEDVGKGGGRRQDTTTRNSC